MAAILDTLPFRDELLSIERLEERARALAARFTVDPYRRMARSVFPRFDDNAQVLRQAYRALAADVHQGKFITPAGEWLLDNYHLVDSEIRVVRQNLPRGYYRELPKLAARDLAGNARVYALAVELIRHSDSRLDRQQLARFLDGFQTVAPLTIGELWAWPSMLKLALIENLRRLADQTMEARSARRAADGYVARIDAAGKGAVPPLPRSLHAAHVVQLMHRVREYGPRLSALRRELDAHVAQGGHTAEEAIRSEHQREAATQVSVANAITSLRLCAEIDWPQFVESVSLVERVLQRDPAGVHGRMEFLSRDRYRQAVEELAEPSGEAQVRVALRAVESAREVAEVEGPGARAAHVGHHLIGKGRRGLESDVAWRPGFLKGLRRLAFSHAPFLYLAAIAIATAGLVAAGVAYARMEHGSLRGQVAVALLLLLPASELAISIVQRLAARLAPPRRLPRLDFEGGIPEDARTLVVVPTLLGSAAGVEELVQHLEVLALGNLDPRIHFAILGDFCDAEAREMPEDDVILAAARDGVEALNARLSEGRGDRFFLLHRTRQWNPGEGVWMGWERKRGKLEELNRLLRGATDTSFAVQVGVTAILPAVRYCITLDTDTRLPRDAARKLIGIIAHPLNRPRFDAACGRVTEGYGILQPRVSVATSSAAGSRFARIFAGQTTVDPYTTAVSDTYQDLFGEGTFTGKGLYDVDAFAAALTGRVPDNALLSHDLFEGLHARAALVTDVEVVDDYPSNVLAHARRQHRWARGDWQILAWLFPFVPTRTGLQRNHLPILVAVEDPRQPAAQPARAGDRGPPARRVDDPAWEPGGLDGAGRPGHRLPAPAAGVRGHRRPNAAAAVAGLPARAPGGRRGRAGARPAPVRLPRQPGPRDAARHPDHPGPARVHAAEAARVGDRGGERGPRGGGPGRRRSAPVLGRDGGQPGHRRRRTPRGHGLPTVRALGRGAGPRALGRRAVHRPWPEPCRSPARPGRRRPRLPPRGGAQDLGVVRRLHGAGGPRPATRQLPGGPRSEGGAPDLADQHRHGAALRPVRPRPRLHRDGGARRADRRGAHHGGGAGAARGASLQLVRHGEPGAARAPLRLHGRQRQPGRSARRARRGAPGAASVGGLAALATRASAFAYGMDFRFLYDPRRRLLSIGYRAADADGPGELDASHYDLLASEARLASFFAIAKGDLPELHWFRLGRTVTGVHGVPTLLSWSGTMFEYLMPLLLMRSYPGTLLEESCRAAVRRQRDYAVERGVPWGISESAYDLVDRHENYQYKAFGVPGLGLKRGLGDELVVAPYAAALATLVDPEAAVRNLRRLTAEGLEGAHGYFDAVDFTRRRSDDPGAPVPEKGAVEGAIVRTYLAHHQGMTLTAIANALQGNRMVERFHADPRVRATELLLQEKAPRHAPFARPRPDEATTRTPPVPPVEVRRFRSAHTPYPHAQFLSNGNYTAVVTNAGGGSSFCRGRAVTRSRLDATCDPGSQFLYLRDVRSGRVWSATQHPTPGEAEDYLVTFAVERATFHRREDEIGTQLDIAVSPEDDVEVRRLVVTNHSDRVREIEVTSYAEIVLGPAADDLAHPSFGKLFVESEYVAGSAALLCHRRPRAPDDAPAWGLHVISQEGRTQGPVEWETDRARFLGRGRSPRDPQALDGRSLTGTTGVLLDPIVSLRQRIRLAPGGVARMSFATGMTGSRETALALAQRYRDPSATARTFALASAHARSTLRHLGISADEALVFERLASRVLRSDASLRAPSELLARTTLGQAGLWPHGISGDLPILLARVVTADGLSLVRQVLQAQEYWRLKGLRADVVILNEHPTSYLDEAHGALTVLLDDGPWRAWKDRPGGVYLLRRDRMPDAEHLLLTTVARAIVSDDRGELARQLDRPSSPWTEPPAQVIAPAPAAPQLAPAPVPPLALANGLGGFADQGRAYVVVLEGPEETPSPWVNVIANPGFGTIVSASGSAFTWSMNSRENRLTPFANDPVTDPTGEAIFLRDEDTGTSWTPTPGPLPRTGTSGRHVVRHAAGVTRFARAANGIRQRAGRLRG